MSSYEALSDNTQRLTEISVSMLTQT